MRSYDASCRNRPSQISSAQHSRKAVRKPKNWMHALKKINECTPKVNEGQFCVFRRVSSRWVLLFYTFIGLRASVSIFILITLFLCVNCRNEKQGTTWSNVQETSKEKDKASILRDREEMPSWMDTVCNRAANSRALLNYPLLICQPMNDWTDAGINRRLNTQGQKLTKATCLQNSEAYAR